MRSRRSIDLIAHARAENRHVPHVRRYVGHPAIADNSRGEFEYKKKVVDTIMA